MNVVSPASMSRLSDVFHCLNLKNRSSAPPEPVSTASIETSSSLFRGLGGGVDRESISHTPTTNAIVGDAPVGRGD